MAWSPPPYYSPPPYTVSSTSPVTDLPSPSSSPASPRLAVARSLPGSLLVVVCSLLGLLALLGSYSLLANMASLLAQ